MDLILAWVASASAGLNPIIIKLSSKYLVKSPWLFNVLWASFALPFLIPYALSRGAGWPENWQPIILMSVSSALFYIFYTLSIYKIDVTVMAPLFSLRTVFAVILGVVLLNESFDVINAILIALIISFSPLAAYNQETKLKSFFQRPVLLAITGNLFLALLGYFTNISSNQNGYATTLLWPGIFTALLLLPTLKLVGSQERKITKQKLAPFLFIGFMDFTYFSTSTEAYAWNLAISSVIISLPFSMFFAVIFGIRYPSLIENNPTKVYLIRFIAAFVMITAAVALTLKQ